MVYQFISREGAQDARTPQKFTQIRFAFKTRRTATIRKALKRGLAEAALGAGRF